MPIPANLKNSGNKDLDQRQETAYMLGYKTKEAEDGKKKGFGGLRGPVLVTVIMVGVFMWFIITLGK